MAFLFRPTYTKVDPATGKRVKKKARCWYGSYSDGAGTTHRLKLSANKTAAQQMLNELVRKSELERVGIRDPFADHHKRPLLEHLADWEKSLQAGEASHKHVRQTVTCVRKLIAGCRFVFPADLSSSRVQSFLADLRERNDGSDALDPTTEWYTRNELAEAVGVKPSAIPSLVARHRLSAVGNGKARRFPRSTAEALLALRSKGCGPKTANQYLAAVKQFARWMVLDRRAAENPLAHLSGANTRTDRRRNRRPLGEGELARLIEAAKSSSVEARSLTGLDRAVLYAVAAGTGFRAGELACLKPRNFDLGAAVPTVTLAGEYTKNGLTAVQPLSPHLAETLRGYLRSRPADQPVWPGTWHERAADLIRVDLDLAGIPYVVDGPDGRRYADFHSLRHTYIAHLDRTGATLKEAMQLARHSDPKLTMAVYGRAQLHDLGAAVGRLPAVSVGPMDETARTPGTDSACIPACTELVQAADGDGGQVRVFGEKESSNVGNGIGLNPLANQEIEAECGTVVANNQSSARRIRTFNPPVNSGMAVGSNPLSTNASGKQQGQLVLPLVLANQHPELSIVIDSWPMLSEPIRQAILALVRTAAEAELRP